MVALITAADLGIDTKTEQGLFDWLLASLLFGRPVPQKTAANAYRRFKGSRRLGHPGPLHRRR